jgi:hypothetical protein
VQLKNRQRANQFIVRAKITFAKGKVIAPDHIFAKSRLLRENALKVATIIHVYVFLCRLTSQIQVQMLQLHT